MSDPIQIMIGVISILSGVKGLYEWISGNTIGDRLKRMEERLGPVEILSDHIGLSHETEFRDPTKQQQDLCENNNIIYEVVHPIQFSIGTDVIVSRPLAAPKEIQTKLTKPELYLSNIQPITPLLHSQSIKDPSVIPITFKANSKQLVGFLKRGHIEDFLGCEYLPLVNPPVSVNQTSSLMDKIVAPSVLPDGRISVDCAYCKGDGREPASGGKLWQHYYISEKCSVCKGRRMVLIATNDLLVKCPLCSGTGHEPTKDGWFVNQKCRECKGLGVIALTGSIRVLNI